MGLNDTAEQLDACRQQSVRDEARIAELRREVERRDYRVTELEYALTRAESALADRLQHDAHAHPTHATIDHAALIEALTEVVPLGEHDWQGISTPFAEALAARVVALLQPADGVLITPEEAQLAIRAARHSAESIRAVLEVDPTRLHPDVAPYVDRLTDLADRLQQHA